MSSIDIDRNVRVMLDLASAAWPHVQAAARLANGFEVNDYLEIWWQAMWELVVEVALPHDQRLDPLRPADLYPDSPRVSYPAALPTHGMVCRSDGPIAELAGELVVLEPMDVEDFVTVREDGKFYDEAPFTHVRVSSGGVFRVADVRFELAPSIDAR